MYPCEIPDAIASIRDGAVARASTDDGTLEIRSPNSSPLNNVVSDFELVTINEDGIDREHIDGFKLWITIKKYDFEVVTE